MSMPETAVDEDDGPVFRQNHLYKDDFSKIIIAIIELCKMIITMMIFAE